MCSYVIFMQGASKNGGHQLNNNDFVIHHCPVYAAVSTLQSLIFLFNTQALSNFFMCQTEIWQGHVEKSHKRHLYPQALDVFTVSSKWIQMEKPLPLWDRYLLLLFLWVHSLSLVTGKLWCKGLSTLMMQGPLVVLCNSPKIWKVNESVVENVPKWRTNPRIAVPTQSWTKSSKLACCDLNIFVLTRSTKHKNNNCERYLDFHASVHLHLNCRIVFTAAKFEFAQHLRVRGFRLHVFPVVVFLMSGVRTIKSFLTHKPVLYAAEAPKGLERKGKFKHKLLLIQNTHRNFILAFSFFCKDLGHKIFIPAGVLKCSSCFKTH